MEVEKWKIQIVKGAQSKTFDATGKKFRPVAAEVCAKITAADLAEFDGQIGDEVVIKGWPVDESGGPIKRATSGKYRLGMSITPVHAVPQPPVES